jgi:hypothetical protein
LTVVGSDLVISLTDKDGTNPTTKVVPLADIANNQSFQETLIANNYFTSSLAGDVNFITELGANEQFVTNVVNNPKFISELTSIVKANETITTLVKDPLNNGKYVYTNEASTPVIIDVVGDVITNASTIFNNPDVTTIIKNISTKAEGNVTFNSTTNEFSYTDSAGVSQLVDISSIVKANETLTSLSLDDSKLTYNDEKGVPNEIDLGNLVANQIVNNESVTTLQLVGKKLIYQNEDGSNPEVDLSSIADAAWNLKGNSGTDATTNFVGTLDDVDLAFRTNNVEKMRILSNGFVGIANNNPQYALDIIGDAKISNNVYCASIFTTSDVRLKKDVKNLDNGLKTISLLRPVSYLKKNSMDSKNYNIKESGFIAQEVRKVLPDLVTEMNDVDKTLIVNYNAIIPILTKAVQEQQVQIEAQQKQIDLLIKALENKK